MKQFKQCAMCGENKDASEGGTTPCCDWFVCGDCLEGGAMLVDFSVATPRCAWCRTEIEDQEAWREALGETELATLGERLAADSSGAANVSDAERREVAWMYGGYIHDCGYRWAITEGCDVIKCPSCGKLANTLGHGEHTFQREGLARDLQTFSAESSVEAAYALLTTYPAAAAALYLGELLETMRVGDPADVYNTLGDDYWGGFKAFLYWKLLVPARPNLQASASRVDWSSRTTLAATVDDSMISALLVNYVDPEHEFQRGRTRIALIGQITDHTVKAGLQERLRDDSWWTS